MVSPISKNSKTVSYATAQYNAAKPNEKGKKKYIVVKGDNLWNIAKTHIQKNNAKKSEISNFMYEIAKLNKKYNKTTNSKETHHTINRNKLSANIKRNK